MTTKRSIPAIIAELVSAIEPMKSSAEKAMPNISVKRMKAYLIYHLDDEDEAPFDPDEFYWTHIRPYENE